MLFFFFFILFFFKVAEKLLLSAITSNSNVSAIDRSLASLRFRIVTASLSLSLPRSYYVSHLAAGTSKLRQYTSTGDVRHTRRITRLMKILITETWNPAGYAKRSAARAPALERPHFVFIPRDAAPFRVIPRFSTAIIPESRDYASLPRGTFSGTTPAARTGTGGVYAYGSSLQFGRRRRRRSLSPARDCRHPPPARVILWTGRNRACQPGYRE